MMGFTNNLRIFLALDPVDMRKSFDGLSIIAEKLVTGGLRGGALFVFTNKRCNRFKALYYDRTGVCVLAKRLEEGTFAWPDPSQPEQQQITLSPEALHLLFDGVDLRGPKLRPWYERDAK